MTNETPAHEVLQALKGIKDWMIDEVEPTTQGYGIYLAEVENAIEKAEEVIVLRGEKRKLLEEKMVVYRMGMNEVLRECAAHPLYKNKRGEEALILVADKLEELA